jgi:hypothetical protein
MFILYAKETLHGWYLYWLSGELFTPKTFSGLGDAQDYASLKGYAAQRYI